MSWRIRLVISIFLIILSLIVISLLISTETVLYRCEKRSITERKHIWRSLRYQFFLSVVLLCLSIISAVLSAYDVNKPLMVFIYVLIVLFALMLSFSLLNMTRKTRKRNYILCSFAYPRLKTSVVLSNMMIFVACIAFI